MLRSLVGNGCGVAAGRRLAKATGALPVPAIIDDGGLAIKFGEWIERMAVIGFGERITVNGFGERIEQIREGAGAGLAQHNSAGGLGTD